MNRDPERENTRQFEMELHYRQQPEEVWRALADAEEVMRWFAPEAKVSPGKGGSVLWRWNERWSFDTEIEIWEPGRRLRLLETKNEPPGKPTVLAIDFQLSPEKGGTKLRIVHSGFGRGAEWDDELNGISRGWTYELRHMRHYLDRHQGKKRHFAWLTQTSKFNREQSRDIVLGPSAFLSEGSLEGLSEGQAYRMRSTFGENLDGRMFMMLDPVHFSGILDAYGGSVFRYEMEGDTVIVSFELWGDYAREAEAFKKRWQPKLAELLA